MWHLCLFVCPQCYSKSLFKAMANLISWNCQQNWIAIELKVVTARQLHENVIKDSFKWLYFNFYITVAINIIKIIYRWTSLYSIDGDQKWRLACNKFAYKNTKNYSKMGDMSLHKCQFAIADTHICKLKDGDHLYSIWIWTMK